MLDNTSNSSITLTFEQMQAIDEAKKRLSVIESEITNAQKVLKGTKIEADRATKENSYQNELLATVTLQVETKKKELEDLTDVYTKIKSNFTTLQSEIAENTDKYTSLQMNLKNREAKIEKFSIELNERESTLNKLSESLQNKSDVLDLKVVKIKELLSTF